MSKAVEAANGPLATSLKMIIKSKGIKQSFLAEKVGVSRQTISDIIAGRRIAYPAEIIKISLALGTTPNELLGFDDYR